MSDFNPFGEESLPQQLQSGEIASKERERSELMGAIFLAKQFPRNEVAAYSAITKSFARPGLANVALYSFKRGDKRVEGLSIDAAREIARCWENIRCGLQIVSCDEKRVHIRGYALDIQTNTRFDAEDQFKPLIQRKRNNETVWVSADERELRELIGRRGAILIRNAILQVIPTDIKEQAESVARDTRKKVAQGEFKAGPDKVIKALVVAFDEIGVSVEMIENKLGHGVDLVTADEVVELRGIYRSIRDGNSKREDEFEFIRSGAAMGSVNERLKGTKGNDDSQSAVGKTAPKGDAAKGEAGQAAAGAAAVPSGNSG